MWLSAAHILGLHNVIEDCQSRKFRDASKWMRCNIRVKPKVDLSIRRLHSKLTKYFSWKPDPITVSIDALSIWWNYFYSSGVAPFSLIWKLINKIRRECQLALLITPLWLTQSWFSASLKQAIAKPQVFSSRHLQLPGKAMILVAFLLSNNTYKIKDYRKQQNTYSCPPGRI